MRGIKKLHILIIFLLGSLAASTQNPVNVACIGNSVTFGYGLANPAEESYPAILQKQLGKNFIVKNFGYSGATLLRKGHKPYFKTKAFAEALRFKTDIAVIHLGLNDTDPRNFPNFRDEFIPDYNWLIDTLRKQNPLIKIFICKLTPIFTGHPRFLSSTYTWYHLLQKQIEEVASINHIPVIDFYKLLHNRPDLFTDAPTLHPNAQGAAAISNIVYNHITGNFGGLQLPEIFGNHMVLQRDKPIVIWGKANAGTVVRVQLANRHQQVTVAHDGEWKIVFPAMKANAIPQTLHIQNEGKQIRFHNILIGDVWLASGQSNMYFPLSQSKNGDSLLKKSIAQKNVRLFKTNGYADTDHQAWDSIAMQKANALDFFSGEWKTNETRAAKAFSAIAYGFATKIQKEINTPVGIIEIAVGGSPQISWVSRQALESNPLFEPAFKNWRQSDYIMQWCRERAGVNLKNAHSPFQRHVYEPSYNFEAGIEKIIPFSIKGVIWYQGESDAENAELYEKLFPVFVQDWRNQWKDDFPFYYVQLSSIERQSWNYFRDAQRRLLKNVPNSGMVVTSDLGDKTDVHYVDKIPVAQRLAQLALSQTYQKKIIPSGPLLKQASPAGAQIVLSFTNADGLQTSDHLPLRGVQCIDDKGIFYPAKAVIKNDKVYIEKPGGIKIEKVAYGWEPFTRANLVNKAHLPASTFLADVNYK